VSNSVAAKGEVRASAWKEDNSLRFGLSQEIVAISVSTVQSPPAH
jgi:hypothetical protein